ncbi:MAG: hypothetical protein IT350_19595 [Deltaproteobacteria bacterium]|nr:hypothetical protein [Deltaproteobacteria bacterium]
MDLVHLVQGSPYASRSQPLFAGYVARDFAPDDGDRITEATERTLGRHAMC